MKKLILVLLVLGLVLAAGTAAAADAGILGKPFPEFTATDTQGNTFTLSEALKDHEAVLINLWATWCPPCEREFPDLNDVYGRYGDRVAFIACPRSKMTTWRRSKITGPPTASAFPWGGTKPG